MIKDQVNKFIAISVHIGSHLLQSAHVRLLLQLIAARLWYVLFIKGDKNIMTAAEIQKKRDALAALEEARLRLNTGTLAIMVRIDGNETTFQRTNMSNLLAQISDLKNDIAPYDSVAEQPVSNAVVRNTRMFL